MFLYDLKLIYLKLECEISKHFGHYYYMCMLFQVCTFIYLYIYLLVLMLVQEL